MQELSFVLVQCCPSTGLCVDHVPGFPGAHTQAESLDELQTNLHEVIAMLREENYLEARCLTES